MVTTSCARWRGMFLLMPLVGVGVATGLLIARLHHGFVALLLLIAVTQAFASLASP
jgi:hypothetical protein